MKIYLGVQTKGDYEIISYLNELRPNEIGAEINAYYYRKQSFTRKLAQSISDEEIPIMIDSGAFQTYHYQTKLIKDEYLRNIAKKLNPDFLLAPDIIGDPLKTKQNLLDFIEKNDDLELLAPLQSINYGPIQRELIEEDIKILQEKGYTKFGFGRPYSIKMTRRESLKYLSPIIRPIVGYLHYLGYPLGDGIHGTHLLDSVDVGTNRLMYRYGFQVWKNPEESARILSDLIDIEQTLRPIRLKQTMAQIATKHDQEGES